MEHANIIDPSLIEIDIDLYIKEDILRKMASNLVEGGYVKETYVDAILQREKTFPTGISTEPLGVAIPHADVEHVIKPALSIATLKEPVKFLSMDDIETEIEVKIIFMLAITNPEFQLDMLRRLAYLFQNKEMLTRLAEAEDIDAMTRTLNEVISMNINKS